MDQKVNNMRQKLIMAYKVIKEKEWKRIVEGDANDQEDKSEKEEDEAKKDPK